jgi:hypothetical protein
MKKPISLTNLIASIWRGETHTDVLGEAFWAWAKPLIGSFLLLLLAVAVKVVAKNLFHGK